MNEHRNVLLESQLLAVREQIDCLATVTDNNLRAILHWLVTHETRALHSSAEAAKSANNQCTRILALHTPFGNDLRFTLAAIRIIQDYEHLDQLIQSLGRRITRCAHTSAARFLPTFTTTLLGVVDTHAAVRESLHLPNDFSQLNLRIKGLTAATEAGIDSVQTEIMAIMLQDENQTDELFELILACRNLGQMSELLESIPEEFCTFAAVQDTKAA